MHVSRIDFVAGVAVVIADDGNAVTVPLTVGDTVRAIALDVVAHSANLPPPDEKRRARIDALRAEHSSTERRRYDRPNDRGLDQLSIQEELGPLEEVERMSATADLVGMIARLGDVVVGDVKVRA